MIRSLLHRSQSRQVRATFYNMDIHQILQLSTGVSILVVWLFRSNTPTKYRVGNATTLQGEISEAGLPLWVYHVLRVLKPATALTLIVGLLYDPLTLPSVACTTVLMTGAIAMHVHARDSIMKTAPAMILFVFCIVVLQHTI